MADVIKQYSIKINADVKDSKNYIDSLGKSAGDNLEKKFSKMEEKISGHFGKITE